MSEISQSDFEQAGGSVDQLGKGAYFWVYLSPENDTAKVVKDWVVTLTQGNWTGRITSEDPKPSLQTKGMSGVFDVQVEWRKPPSGLPVELTPLPESPPDVGCNSNCAAMVGIVADKQETSANYWTVSDAYCPHDE